MATKITEEQWQNIELLYRLDQSATTDIAEAFGCSEALIRKRAKKYAWVKDLSTKIRATADGKVIAARINATPNKRVTERDLIESEAEAQKHVRLTHRDDIRQRFSIVTALANELYEETINIGEYLKLGEMLADPSVTDEALQRAYRGAISLPSRIDCIKKLSEATKTLVGLEREAFGISDNSNGEANKASEDSMLAALNAGRLRAANKKAVE